MLGIGEIVVLFVSFGIPLAILSVIVVVGIRLLRAVAQLQASLQRIEDRLNKQEGAF
ncbi:hypothetical protein HC891_13085 [Candidatus Gracilibacteria bacterium]|nr:hypothetical protein [Candidatus Gracilibacteria bacterium]